VEADRICCCLPVGLSGKPGNEICQSTPSRKNIWVVIRCLRPESRRICAYRLIPMPRQNLMQERSPPFHLRLKKLHIHTGSIRILSPAVKAGTDLTP